MSSKKLSIEDFYHQFHGIEHHNDSGDQIKPMKYLMGHKSSKTHKGLDLNTLRNKKKKRYVVVHKNIDAIKHELSQGKSRK